MSLVNGQVIVSERVSVTGTPFIELRTYFEESVSGIPTRTVGAGFSIRDKAGNIYDLPIITYTIPSGGGVNYVRSMFNLEPGTSDYVTVSATYPGFPTDPLNLPNGLYDVRSSLWAETSEPLSTRIGDTDWIINGLTLSGAVAPEEIPEEVPITPPVEEAPPTVEPTLLEKFLNALKTIARPQYLIPGVLIPPILSTYLGRAVKDEDISKYTDKLVEFLPIFNVISKSTYGIDLTTGEKADIGDITEDEAIAAVLDIGFAAVGAKALSLGMAAASEARAAQFLMKIFSTPAALKARGIQYGSYLRKALTTTTASLGSSTVLRPTLSTGILANLAAGIKANPYHLMVAGMIMASQLDVIGWGFDSLPSQVRARQKDRYKAFQSLMFSLQDALDVEDYTNATIIAIEMRTLLEEIEDDLANRVPQFWENRGVNYEDIRAIVRGFRAALNSLMDQYPQIAVDFDRAPVPEELRGTVTNVVDGDTFDIAAVGAPRPEYRVRMLMLDTHESGTDAGSDESDYLASLIMNKPVVVLVDQYNQWGRYGRVLGVVVIETPEGLQNINLEMLRTYGSDILTATKYHDKNKYVDWDEAVRVVQTAPVELPEPRKPTLSMIKSQFVAGIISETEARHELEALNYAAKDLEDIFVQFIWAKDAKEAKEAPPVVEPEIPGIPVILPTEPGAIKIYSTPNFANIYLDGEYAFKLTTETLKGLAPGPHAIRLTVEGYDDWEEIVDVQPGITHEIRAALKKVVY